MSSNRKQSHELYLVRHLCEEALGRQIRGVKSQDRPDVLVQFATKFVGIEVTVFHADENASRKGSLLRMEEQAKAGRAKALGGTYQVFVPDIDPNAALAERVLDKCRRVGLKTAQNTELWLLVAGGLVDDIGRLAATGVDPDKIQVAELNRLSHYALTESEFDRAYFDVHSWGRLFEWTRRAKWKAVNCKSSPRIARLS